MSEKHCLVRPRFRQHKMGATKIYLFLALSVNIISGQIVFPENDIDPTIKNRDNRHPIYAPSKCPENELFYPGDQKNDWICDCRPAYLYHPASDKCHAAYRRGPCAERQYLVLPPGGVVPKCAANPCLYDGLVPWKSGCSRLDAEGACPVEAGRALRLGVNSKTLSLECQQVTFASRIGDVDELSGLTSVTGDAASTVACPPGGRRSIAGLCARPTSHISDGSIVFKLS